MTKKIKTNLPINKKNIDDSIFVKRQYYFMPQLKVRSLNNVFLSHYGVLLKNMLTIKRSLPNALGFFKPNGGFVFNFYRKALEVFLVCKYGKSLKYITLDQNKRYLFVYTPWFGYFSWVTESLPRILEVLEEHKGLHLILPEAYSKKKFVVDSLKLYPELKIEVIPEGVHMKAPNLIMPELKPFTYSFCPNTMQKYREFVWAKLDTMKMNIPTFDKIYVSRKKAKNRKLLNEKSVLEVLENHGFKEIIFEDYSFWEQVYLMKNCKVLTGVHGAGFANISFMNEGSVLYEFIKEYSSYKEERPSYWRLSSALNINYYIHYCKPEKYGDYDLWVGVNLIANVEVIDKTLEEINDFIEV